MGATTFYRQLHRYGDAARILKLVDQNSHDPFGTSAEFYYILAFCSAQSGAEAESAAYLAKARAAKDQIDRFPYREESIWALQWAVRKDPNDAVARFTLACLQFYLDRPGAAIQQLEAAAAVSPNEFRIRRTLGLAYAEQNQGVEKAAAQLEKAVAIDPADVRTLNDLSSLYARSGRFDEQIALLRKAIERSPNDDNLAEQVLAASLVKGRYDDAAKLIATHKFQPRHRSYGLRDKYRSMQFGMGAAAFKQGKYAEAARLFESALKPPLSLGVDDFASQTSPRVSYYVGRSLEAEGKTAEAKQAYEKAISGMGTL
ncbi:MAG: tetratricopeptide repeat protein [Acidobacteria bacterium]|nr:tetratricopeptide repeat protein [Acidobacteriota bacterium]